MNVKELKEKLKDIPDDYEVFICDTYSNQGDDLNALYVDTVWVNEEIDSYYTINLNRKDKSHKNVIITTNSSL